MEEAASYPVRFEVTYPSTLNKILNFPLFIGTLIKAVLAIPHLIIVGLLQYVLYVPWLIGPFAILFTGSYPRGLYNFHAGIYRWMARTYAYVFSLTDQYPPFSFNEEEGDTSRLLFDYPATLNRSLNFPILGTLVKTILVIPQLLVLLVGVILSLILVFIAQFSILFTGQFPRGMFDLVVGTFQLLWRIYAYIFSLTDAYPPFSLSADS